MIPSHISFSALCTYFSCTILQTAVQCTSYILTDKDYHRWSFLLVYIVLLTCLNKFKIIAGWLAYNFIDFGWSLQTVVWNRFTAGQPIPMRWVNKLEKKTNDNVDFRLIIHNLMNSHGNFTKSGIDFPLKSRQNLLIINDHLIMPRKLTLQQRIFIVSESKDTPFAALIQLFIAKFPGITPPTRKAVYSREQNDINKQEGSSVIVLIS